MSGQCKVSVSCAPFRCLLRLLFDLSPIALALGLLALLCCLKDFDVMCKADDKGTLSGDLFLESRGFPRKTGVVHMDLQSLKVCRARLG